MLLKSIILENDLLLSKYFCHWEHSTRFHFFPLSFLLRNLFRQFCWAFISWWLLTIKRFVLACCLILSKALSQSNSISSKMRGKLWLWLLSIPLPFHIPALQTFSPSQQSLEWQAFNYLLGRMLHCNHIFSSGNDILFFVCHFIDPPTDREWSSLLGIEQWIRQAMFTFVWVWWQLVSHISRWWLSVHLLWTTVVLLSPSYDSDGTGAHRRRQIVQLWLFWILQSSHFSD